MAVGRSPFAGRFERGHLTTEFNDSAAVVADSAFFGTVAAKIDAGGVASTTVGGGVTLTAGTPRSLTPGGLAPAAVAGGATLAPGVTGSITPGGVPSTVVTGGADLSTPTMLTPGGVASSQTTGGALVRASITEIFPGGVPSSSDAGSVLMSGDLEPRVPGNFYDRWSSGVHIGATQPTQRVMLRTGRFWRRNANWHGPEMDVKISGTPNKPWQAYWTPEPPAEEYREIPNVREVRLEQSLDQNGITSATITIENIFYRPEAAGQHSIKRGYMAPLRGYVGPGQAPLSDEQGEALAQNEWFGLLGRESQVTVYQGYGDAEIKAFTGLIDDVDTTSRPDVITITARDFGKILNDERLFGWNKEPKVKDPVIFIDKDDADNITKVGSDANASSERNSAHDAAKVLDGDGDTAWWSDWHTGPDNTEYVEIRLPEGRYNDYYLNLDQFHSDVYVSLNPKTLSDDGPPTMNGDPITENVWAGGGDIPGSFGGINYIVHLNDVNAGGKVRSLGDEYRVGDNSLLRISLRGLPLMAIDPGRFGATVVALKARKRVLKEEAKERRWVRVGDTSDVVRQILRWAGFKHFIVDQTGVSLPKQFVANRGMTYMDVIQRMKDLAGFTFFISDPTKGSNSIGVPVFRKSLIATDAAPVVTIDDNSLLNAIEVKQSDESLAYIIRVRGRVSSNGQRVGSSSEERIMFTYRPPWGYQINSGVIDKLGGVIKHVIYTDKMFKTKDDVKFGAYYIALQEALASMQATAQIAGNPGPQLDDHVGLLDLGTGVTSRLSIQSRSSTFTRAADQTAWSLTLGGALVDEPDVSAMVAIIEAARRS